MYPHEIRPLFLVTFSLGVHHKNIRASNLPNILHITSPVLAKHQPLIYQHIQVNSQDIPPLKISSFFIPYVSFLSKNTQNMFRKDVHSFPVNEDPPNKIPITTSTTRQSAPSVSITESAPCSDSSSFKRPAWPGLQEMRRVGVREPKGC